MGLSLVLKFALIFSLYLARAAASLATETKLTIFDSHLELALAISPSARPKATTLDVLALFGTPQQIATVDPAVAQALFSCFKFLAPFNHESDSHRRSLSSKLAVGDEISELILSPPVSIIELARAAAGLEANATITAVRTAVRGKLDPAMIPVPDVEGSREDGCSLACLTAQRFQSQETNAYLTHLFDAIVERGPSVGLSVSLNRYDLFHGHLFISLQSQRLGILFHAREYPAGFEQNGCEHRSNVVYDESMNLRNILWLAPLPSNNPGEFLAPGVLVVLDADPEGIIYQDLITMEHYRPARTLLDVDFGRVPVQVNYLNVGDEVPDFQLYICE